MKHFNMKLFVMTPFNGCGRAFFIIVAIIALLICVCYMYWWQITVLHSELKTMREFRRKRAELQEQLETMRQALGDAHHNHEQQVISLEQKYFEEKVRW